VPGRKSGSDDFDVPIDNRWKDIIYAHAAVKKTLKWIVAGKIVIAADGGLPGE
jgi:hypothetical protein